MPSVHYIDKEFLSRAGVRRAPRTARQIRTSLRRDPDYFCFFPGETRERRAARRDGDGIPRQGVVLDIASTPNTPRERKKGSPASVFDFDSHAASRKNDAQEGAVADDRASIAASPHSDKGDPKQLEHERGGTKSPPTCYKLGGFEEGQNVWVRTGKAHHSEYPAVIVSLRDGGDGSGTARVRWTTSNTIDEVEVGHLVPMFGGGEADAHGERRGRETDHAAHDVVGDDEMQAGPAEMAKLRHRRLSPDEDDVDQVELSATSTALRKRTPSEEKDTPASDGPVKLIPGLELQRNGKWSTSIYFRGKSRYMGLFDTYDEAVLAHEAARGEMATDEGSVEAVVQLAKESAAEAVRRSQEMAYNDTLEPSDDESTAPMAREAALEAASQGNAVPKPTLSKKKKRSTAGITKTSAGKWQLKICYRGQQRYYGTYDTIDQASLANETARKIFEADKGMELSSKDIQHNIQSAKDAIRDALARTKASQACAECRRIKQKCVITPPNTECDRCLSKPGRKCLFDSPQGGADEVLPAKSRALRKRSVPLEEKDAPVANATKSTTANDKETAKIPLGYLGRQLYGKWSVLIPFRGKSRYIGVFDTKTQAAVARDIAHEILETGQGSTDAIVNLAKEAARKVKETARNDVSNAVSCDTETAASETDQDVAMDDSARERDDLHSASSSIDYGSFNVFRARHKKWETRIHYHGKKRQVGTFATRTAAAKANEIAHGMLVLTEDLELTPAEIEENVARAKEAAKDAVYETDGVENDTDVSEEDVSNEDASEEDASKEDVSSVDASEEEAPEEDASEEEASEEDVSEEHASCAASETPLDLLSEPAKQQIEEETRLEDELTHNDSCEPNEEEPHEDDEEEEKSPIFGQTTGGDNATWVNCDRCKKWRRLRDVVDANELSSQWYCSMNKADPNRAQCSAPEEEYDHHARRLQSLRVYATASGKKWYAELFYINKNRHLGTFATIEQAFFANAFARELALATEDLQLTEEEAKQNVKLIKTRAAEVLSRFVAGTRAQTSNATVRESPSAQEHYPFRRVGVKESHSGQWEIAFPYQGSQCIIGPFATQEDAAIANAVAQGYLAAKDKQELTDAEVQQNIDLAKEAASNAVSRLTRTRQADPRHQECHSTAAEPKIGKFPPAPPSSTKTPSTRPCGQCGFLLLDNQTHCAMCLAAAVPTDSLQPPDSSHSGASDLRSGLDDAHGYLLAKYHSTIDNGAPKSGSAHLAGAQTTSEDDAEDEEWLCDICNTARFTSYDEAVEHERNCVGIPPPELSVECSNTAETEEDFRSKGGADLAVVAATSHVDDDRSGTPTEAFASSPNEPNATNALSELLTSQGNEANDQVNTAAQPAVHASREVWHESYRQPFHHGLYPLPQPTLFPGVCRDMIPRVQQPWAFGHAIARSRHIYNLQRMAPGQNPVSGGQTALISQDAPWFYVDLQGSVQGPFAGLQMRRWLDSGQLSDGLRISQNRGGPYSALSSYFPDRSVAFIGPTSREKAPEAKERPLEDMAIDVEIDQCENEADPEGPKLLLGEQPVEAFDLWLSDRKRKWGRCMLKETPELSDGGKRRKPQNRVVKTFSERVDDLKAYKAKHGHLNVKRNEDKSLVDFMYNVRQGRRSGTGIAMSVDRIGSLDAIGFDWRRKIGEDEEVEERSLTPGASNATWVECDRCKKWRSLPGDVDGNELPSQWYCSMNTTDPGRAQCSAPEEEYDEATSAPDSALGQLSRQVQHVHCNGAFGVSPKHGKVAPVGVYATTSGKWKVELNYNKKNRAMGTYKTVEQAAFVNAFARELAPKDLQMAEEEAKENIKLIKTRAAEVLTQFVANAGTKAGRESPSAQEPCPFRTVGVKEMPSGQWEVAFPCQESQCIIGSFATREEAAIANAVAQGYLAAKDKQGLTDAEIQQNIDLAKEAASNAMLQYTRGQKRTVSRKTVDVAQTGPSGEDAPSGEGALLNLEILQFEDEAHCDQPKLRRGRFQLKKEFTAWHTERKRKWGRQPHNLRPVKLAPFSKATVEYLNAWMTQNEDNPYPDAAQRAKMVAHTGLSRKQLSDWMSKARKKKNLQKSDNVAPAPPIETETGETETSIKSGTLSFGVGDILARPPSPNEMQQCEVEGGEDDVHEGEVSDEAEITTEDTLLDAELRNHELEADPSGPQLLLGEQPAKEFKAWLSDRKRKWGRGRGPNDADTQDGTDADIAIAPGICQESNIVSRLSAGVDEEGVEVPRVAETSVDEAMLDIEILRCEGGADIAGPQLLRGDQPMEEFKVWLSDRKRKWGRLDSDNDRSCAGIPPPELSDDECSKVAEIEEELFWKEMQSKGTRSEEPPTELPHTNAASTAGGMAGFAHAPSSTDVGATATTVNAMAYSVHPGTGAAPAPSQSVGILHYSMPHTRHPGGIAAGHVHMPLSDNVGAVAMTVHAVPHAVHSGPPMTGFSVALPIPWGTLKSSKTRQPRYCDCGAVACPSRFAALDTEEMDTRGVAANLHMVPEYCKPEFDTSLGERGFDNPKLWKKRPQIGIGHFRPEDRYDIVNETVGEDGNNFRRTSDRNVIIRPELSLEEMVEEAQLHTDLRRLDPQLYKKEKLEERAMGKLRPALCIAELCELKRKISGRSTKTDSDGEDRDSTGQKCKEDRAL